MRTVYYYEVVSEDGDIYEISSLKPYKEGSRVECWVNAAGHFVMRPYRKTRK